MSLEKRQILVNWEGDEMDCICNEWGNTFKGKTSYRSRGHFGPGRCIECGGTGEVPYTVVYACYDDDAKKHENDFASCPKCEGSGKCLICKGEGVLKFLRRKRN